jgi:O-6-methylguanine DNA methyltransferase
MNQFGITGQLESLAGRAPSLLLRSVEVGTGLVDGYSLYETHLGEVMVTFNPRGVTSVDLAEGDREGRFEARFGRKAAPAQPPSPWAKEIGRALELGRPGSVPVDLEGMSEFRQRILRIAATIPRGQVRPYSWLAMEVGSPGAARAVGSTMAHNPVPLIVPCHRVVRSDGRIGQYSLGGPHNKWSLLTWEGADPGRLEELAAAGFRYVGSDATGVFCYPTCANARRIAAANLQRFRSKESAASAGYRRCAACRP